MSKTSIHIQGLGKMYKLYRRQADKVLDAFNLNRLLFWRKNYYQEFWALRDLNLEVAKGERLGIIGRNGAGKSTLLKIITGNIAPSEGCVAVDGRIQALLELGTGFHPEFTGRENIRASLAYQGLTPAQIREKEEDVIEFAEVDTFIDQPFKTYSAGMSARLSFSTATVIEPEVLIIDEVLGAGDAYFAGKCLERMRTLTEGSGATVLFVSHDLGSVQQLCERVIWIDRGCVVMDGKPLEVTKAYYASILAQEELRLKARNARLGRGQAKELQQKEETQDVKELLFRLVTTNSEPPSESHPIRKITLRRNDAIIESVRPGAPMDNDAEQSMYLMTDKTHMLWREPEVVSGQRFRCFAPTGGKYSHAPFVVGIAGEMWSSGRFDLEIEHSAVPGDNIRVEVFDGEHYHPLGLLTTNKTGWQTEKWPLPMHRLRPEADDDKDRPATPASIEKDPVPATVNEINAETLGAAVDETPSVLTSPPVDKIAAIPPVQHADTINIPASNDDASLLIQQQRDVDKFYTAYAEFAAIRLLDASNRPRVVFAPNETVKLAVEVDVKLPIAVCAFSIAIYSMNNVVIGLAHWPIQEGLPTGKCRWDIAIDQPNIRQAEYLVSCALIKEYSEATNETTIFYCRWNRSLSFRVEEGRVGRTPAGLLFLKTMPPDGNELILDHNRLQQPKKSL